MSTHRRGSTVPAGDASYQPISQEEVDDPIVGSPLQVAGDEEELAEDFVAQERVASHDARIGWIHLILGCAVLLPWNAIITATPYFINRLQGSSLKGTFSSYLSTSFTVSNFLFLAHATAMTKPLTSSRQVMLSLSWLTVLTFMFTISTFFHLQPGFFFAFVILNGIVQAAAGSYLQAAVTAIASLLGPTAIQALMTGQAVIAVAVSGIEVLSAIASIRDVPSSETLAESEPEERSAFIFFGFSTLFLLVSSMAQFWLTKLPAYTAIMEQFITTAEHRRSTTLSDYEPEAHTPLVGSRTRAVPEEKKQQLFRVAKSNFIYNVAVAYVFIVTLSVFPPITISILPTNPATHPLLFSAFHFFVFNVGDWVGRYICSFPRLVIWSAKRLLALSLARTLFIPIFLMCNIQRDADVPAISQAVISSDWLFMCILLLFGLSNGYVSSLCMMSAPSLEHNPRLKGRVEDVDVAANVATFCLVGGLAVGSFTSFGVRAAVCHCNPFKQ